MNNSTIAIGLFAELLESLVWPAFIGFEAKLFPTVAASRHRDHAYAFAAAFFSISLNISLVVTTFFHAIRRHYSPSCCCGEKTDSSECENMPDRIPQSLPTFYFSFQSEKNVWFKTGTTSHCQKDGWEASPLRRRRVRSLNIEKKISSLNRKLNLKSRLGIKIYEKEAIGLNSDNWKAFAERMPSSQLKVK